MLQDYKSATISNVYNHLQQVLKEGVTSEYAPQPTPTLAPKTSPTEAPKNHQLQHQKQHLQMVSQQLLLQRYLCFIFDIYVFSPNFFISVEAMEKKIPGTKRTGNY